MTRSVPDRYARATLGVLLALTGCVDSRRKPLMPDRVTSSQAIDIARRSLVPLRPEDLEGRSYKTLPALLDPDSRLVATSAEDMAFRRGFPVEKTVEPEEAQGDQGRTTSAVRIRSFGRRTALELAAWLRAPDVSGADVVVLDLRGNTGGIVESAVEAASLFIPEDRPVARVLTREGGETIYHSRGGRLRRGGVSVLVDGETASSAEVFCDALRRESGATVVGGPTRGKRSVQEAIALNGRWTLLLTCGWIEAKPDAFAPK